MSDTEAQAARPRRGDELELTIDRLAHGGAGVARHDGYVVFVRGAVPGDRVRARVTKSKRSFAEADSVELLDPSSERVEPVAPHPGAPWQVLPYERQLREKEDQVRDALARIGRFGAPPVEPIVPALEPLRYRNKLEYSFGEDEREELVLGFHRPGRFDLIDDVRLDILASERVDELREAVKAWCREEGLTAWDRRAQLGLLRNLVVREGRRTGQLQARLVTSPGSSFRVDELAAAAPAESFLLTRAAGVAETTRAGETEVVKGSSHLEEELGGLRLRISPDAFFQTNTEMAERLYGAAAELAGLSGRERVLDLFCGIGTIALVLALDAGEVWGVELVEEAVADAIENARLNGVDNARFFAGDVRLAMRPLLERSGQPDVVVVDPPRAGLSQKVVRRVLEAEA
ncbi:MAG: 23S rRNA (uracil(1939)-C(5))-methyltransferase RlmD, partial [Thermoleophilaceae bacterium]